MRSSKISSVQLMLTLIISLLSIILIQNFNNALSSSFFINIISIAIAVVFTMLYFVPTIIIKRKTDLDFLSFVQKTTPTAAVFIAELYSLFFVYAIEFFLLKYTDVFKSTQNPEAAGFFIALVMLSAGIYAASKGISGVTRCGIFIFAFSVLAFAVITLGNISKLDFEVNSVVSNSYNRSPLSVASAFLQISFAAVIFACVSSYVKKFKIKHMVITLVCSGVAVMLLVFFIWFALGNYGTMQDFQIFLLSKSAQLGELGGMDSLYLVLTAMAVFLVLSLCFIGIKNTAKNCKLRFMTLIYGIISFALYIYADNISSVKEILISQDVFNIFIFISAVLIPSVYLIIFRRKLNV